MDPWMDRALSRWIFDQWQIDIHCLRTDIDIPGSPVHERFLPVLGFLESTLMPAHDQLPPAFCHGDLHPLNVIWNNQEIAAVIDWEFAFMNILIDNMAEIKEAFPGTAS